jgi:hypothetical protein
MVAEEVSRRGRLTIAPSQALPGHERRGSEGLTVESAAGDLARR